MIGKGFFSYKSEGRAFWKYYRDFNWSNLIFSLISGAYFGPISGLIIFCSFGTIIGMIGFRYFKGDEYFIYYNLGYSKRALVSRVWGYNLLFALPLLLISFFLL